MSGVDVKGILAQYEKAKFKREGTQTSGWSRALGDVKGFLSSMHRIPGGLWNTVQKSQAQSGLYDMNKPQWKQLSGPKDTASYLKDVLFKPRLPFFMNLPYAADSAITKNWLKSPEKMPIVRNIPFLKEYYKKHGMMKDPTWNLINNLIGDSLIKKTGSWVYDKDVKGRRWFPNPRQEGSRWREWAKNPVMGPLEDIINLAIVGGPAFKALGIGGKMSNLARYGTTFGKYIPKRGLGVGGAFGKHGAATGVQQLTKYGKLTNVVKQGQWRVARFFRKEAKLNDLLSKFNNTMAEGKAGIAQSQFMKSLAKIAPEKRLQITNIAEGSSQVWSGTPKAIKQAANIIRTMAAKKTRYTYNYDLLATKTKAEATDMILKANFGPMAKELGYPFGKDTWRATVQSMVDIGFEPRHFMHIAPKAIVKIGKRGIKPVSAYKPTSVYERKNLEWTGYEKDPMIVIPMEEAMWLKSGAMDRLLGGIRRTFGKPLGKKHPLKAGYKSFTPTNKEALQLCKDPLYRSAAEWQIPETVATELYKMVNPAGGVEKFFRMTWDPATAVWKTSVLAMSPRWLLNNFIGNTILNTLGAVGPTGYIKAIKFLRKARRLAKKNNWTIERAYRRLKFPKGAYEGGIYKMEAGAAIEHLSTNPVLKTLQIATNKTGISKAIKSMYKFNTGIETLFRTAHYFDKVGKGFSKTAAVKSVNMFLFDYGAMSWLEKAAIRRVSPFWAWQKNITRLAFTYPVKHPMRAALIAKARMLAKDEEDFTHVAEWMRYFMKTPFTTAEGDPYYMSARGANPFADVGWGVANLHPAIKIALERATKQQLFKGRGFTSPYPNIQGGVDVGALPSLPRHIGMQFPQVRLIESLLKPYSRYDTGEPMLTKTGEYKYPKNRMLEIMKLFGVSMTPYNIEDMRKKGLERAFNAWKQKQKYEKLYSNMRRR